MKIDIDGVKLLIEILNVDSPDYHDLIRLTNSNSMKGFIQHEKSLYKDIGKNMIINELMILKNNRDYRDKYNLYILKNHISKFSQDLYYIEKNEEKIIEKSLDRVYDFIPRDIRINPIICLYCGGVDGGFTVYRKKIFINYLKYFNEPEEFIKVLSHEMFHCRSIYLKSKLKALFITDYSNKKYIYEIFGKILEEGIASLIQHGSILIKDDPAGTITKTKIDSIEEEFHRLNNILVELKSGRITYSKIKLLDNYSLGYSIVSYLYNLYGKDILLPWIVEYDYKTIIKSYIKAKGYEGLSSGFNNEVEKWLINL